MYHAIHTVASISANEYIGGFRDSEKFIAFCKQCNRYGSCWACPPYDFDEDNYLSGFEKVYVIGTKIMPNEDMRIRYNDAEEVKEAGKRILAEERAKLDPKLLKLENDYPGSKAFFAGTCFRCPEGECTRKMGLPCVHPEKIRPSLEAFGFDIGKTASQLLHIDLKWSNDNSFPEYFTLVSGFFTNYPIIWERDREEQND